MKSFEEALKDGFEHITQITDPDSLNQLRTEGIRVDDEGYYRFSFGEHKEFELCLEPIGDGYLISLYKNRIRITEALPVKPL